MRNRMQFAGVINSEETMAGLLSDGRRVYVELLTVYFAAPEELRGDPEYWRRCIDAGEFEDDENPPMARVE